MTSREKLLKNIADLICQYEIAKENNEIVGCFVYFHRDGFEIGTNDVFEFNGESLQYVKDAINLRKVLDSDSEDDL